MRQKALTLGYEGVSFDEFANKLKENHVKQLIDVRAVPLSRKKGFSKSALQANLKKEKIEYVHIPELGSPKEIRNELKQNGDLEEFFKKYAKHFDKVSNRFKELESLVSSEKSVIMCFERDWRACHRKIICEALQKDGFEVIPV